MTQILLTALGITFAAAGAIVTVFYAPSPHDVQTKAETIARDGAIPPDQLAILNQVQKTQ